MEKYLLLYQKIHYAILLMYKNVLKYYSCIKVIFSSK